MSADERSGAAKRTGRPSKYSKALANRICERLAAGESLRSICADPDIPDKSTVLRWAMDTKHDFHNRYERARIVQIHSLVDDMMDIADDGSNDWYEKRDKDGRFIDYAVDHENINRSKLRVQYRQWLAGKVLPQLYGDKVNLQHSGVDGGPVEIRWAKPGEVDDGPGGGADAEAGDE